MKRFTEISFAFEALVKELGGNILSSVSNQNSEIFQVFSLLGYRLFGRNEKSFMCLALLEGEKKITPFKTTSFVLWTLF